MYIFLFVDLFVAFCLFCLYLFTFIKTSSRMPGNQFINVSNEQTDNNKKRNMNKELRKLVCTGEWGLGRWGETGGLKGTGTKVINLC